MPILSTIDMLTWERHWWHAGYRAIAGVDEVGRGALAGPLVAAAVILPIQSAADLAAEQGWSTVRDSKTVAPARRAAIAEWIWASGALISIAEIPPQELDEIGLGAANRAVMERAVRGLPASPDVLLIDAMTVDLALPQVGIIDGDAQSLSIAAASIVAKVHRDCLMLEHDADYPHFGFGKHKGYGVAAHLDALRAHGPCILHRQSFAPVGLAGAAYGAKQGG